jgi:hypothetical protein
LAAYGDRVVGRDGWWADERLAGLSHGEVDDAAKDRIGDDRYPAMRLPIPFAVPADAIMIDPRMCADVQRPQAALFRAI